MTDIDKTLAAIKAKQEAANMKYADMLAEARSKKMQYDQNLQALKDIGFKDVEEARIHIWKLEEEIADGIEELMGVIK